MQALKAMLFGAKLPPQEEEPPQPVKPAKPEKSTLKDGRAHKFGVSFPQNKWTKTLFCDCGMRFQIEGYRVWQKKRGRTALLFCCLLYTSRCV